MFFNLFNLSSIEVSLLSIGSMLLGIVLTAIYQWVSTRQRAKELALAEQKKELDEKTQLASIQEGLFKQMAELDQRKTAEITRLSNEIADLKLKVEELTRAIVERDLHAIQQEQRITELNQINTDLVSEVNQLREQLASFSPAPSSARRSSRSKPASD